MTLTETPDSIDDVFVLYSRASSGTGPEIGEALGARNDTSAPSDVDCLIRWGASMPVSIDGSYEVLNGREATARNVDKLRSLEIMEAAGVRVPTFSRYRSGVDFPALGRDTSHSGGTDISLLLQEMDMDHSNSDFYTEYIPAKAEFRTHVVGGDVLFHRQKIFTGDSDEYKPHVRNHGNGWTFREPRAQTPDEELAVDAVEAIGLDFGAVDILRGEDGKDYVLEVNTAPSLMDRNVQRYADALRRYMGLQ